MHAAPCGQQMLRYSGNRVAVFAWQLFAGGSVGTGQARASGDLGAHADGRMRHAVIDAGHL